MDKTRIKFIAPSVALAVMVLILVVLIAGKDAVISLLTPENDIVRYIICLILAAAGAFVVYLTLKHIDSKEK